MFVCWCLCTLLGCKFDRMITIYSWKSRKSWNFKNPPGNLLAFCKSSWKNFRIDRYLHYFIGYHSTCVYTISHNLYHISMTLDDCGIRPDTRIFQLLPKGAITSKIKHAIKLKTSSARLAQLLQPSLAFCFCFQPMTAYCPLRSWTACRHWLQAKTKC